MECYDTVYLAGQMTSDPGYVSKFREAARKLEAAGFTVLSPAILPPFGFDYAAYIRMSAAMMDECAAVCFLPDWTRSEGAKGEYRRAKRNGQRIFFYEEWLQKQGLQQGQKYVPTNKETNTLLVRCVKCGTESVLNAKSGDGKRCCACGGYVVPLGYAERAGEEDATK